MSSDCITAKREMAMMTVTTVTSSAFFVTNLRVGRPLAAVSGAVGGGAGAWWSQQPDFTPADPARMAFTLPEKPSIAVFFLKLKCI